MKKVALVLSLMFAGAGIAAAAQDAAKEEPKAPAHKHSSHDMSAKHEVMGGTGPPGAEKKTLTCTNDKGENVTWPAEGKAVASLKTVKPGEKVTISYAVDANGAPKAATEIKAAAPAAAPKTPEKK